MTGILRQAKRGIKTEQGISYVCKRVISTRVRLSRLYVQIYLLVLRVVTSGPIFAISLCYWSDGGKSQHFAQKEIKLNPVYQNFQCSSYLLMTICTFDKALLFTLGIVTFRVEGSHDLIPIPDQVLNRNSIRNAIRRKAKEKTNKPNSQRDRIAIVQLAHWRERTRCI